MVIYQSCKCNGIIFLGRAVRLYVLVVCVSVVVSACAGVPACAGVSVGMGMTCSIGVGVSAGDDDDDAGVEPIDIQMINNVTVTVRYFIRFTFLVKCVIVMTK
jgi:hypothetical protein